MSDKQVSDKQGLEPVEELVSRLRARWEEGGYWPQLGVLVPVPKGHPQYGSEQARKYGGAK